jgi:putative toxin-antitoxin system antitoxin component (TIGR02293 family)
MRRATKMLYISSKIVVDMKRPKTKSNLVEDVTILPLIAQKSAGESSFPFALRKSWLLPLDGRIYTWSNNAERILLVREGIPYTAIEYISNRINSPVKSVLNLLCLPQTTYNKKKAENARLDSRYSELLVLITEVIDYGIEVFNNEEGKFQRWLKKSNISLGGCTPESLFDTSTGIHEVKSALDRIEFGNFA